MNETTQRQGVPDLQRLLDAAPHPYLVLDRHFLVAAANRAFLAAAGRDRADLLGRVVFDAVAAEPDAAARLDASLRRVLATGREDICELPPASAAGAPRAVSHAPVHGEDGEVAFILHHPLPAASAPSLASGGRGDVPALPAEDAASRSALPGPTRLEQMFSQAPGFMAMLRGPDHVFEFVNPAYRQIIGGRDVVGLPLREALPETVEQGYETLLDGVFATGEAFSSRAARYLVQVERGGPVVERYVDFVFQPMRDAAGRVEGIFVEGADVTDRIAADAALRALEERRRLALDIGDVGLWELDLEAGTLELDARMRAMNGVVSGELDRDGAFAAIHPDDRERVERVLQDLAEGRDETAAMDYRVIGIEDGKLRHVEVRARVLPGPSGKVTRLLGAARDITATVEADAQRTFLTAELSHRLKNTLAMVQAIATQTLRKVTERGAVDAFAKRIHALSSAHDVLLQQKWSSARIRPLVDGVLASFDRPERFQVSGPEIEIGPRAALSLSLLLHELATNASKYGSLSVAGGHVRLAWSIEDGAEERELVLDWREEGGPPVETPNVGGFGSRLIRMGLLGTGGVDLHYYQSGFIAEMRAPLSQVQA